MTLESKSSLSTINKFSDHKLAYFLVTLYICSQIRLLWWIKMELQTTILAVALVAIVGPVAGEVYTECQLATILEDQGFTKSLIPDCK
jgi:hypothetical protein